MKLILQGLESELGEVKNLAMDTLTQAKKTNGRVNWLEKTAYTAMGAFPLLTMWAGWLTWKELNPPPSITAEQMQAAMLDAIQEYNVKVLNN